ncbi:hypothetical protein [Geodermatophilus sp. SYSU D00698]
MALLVLGPAWSTDAEPLIDAGRFPLGVETATLTNAARLVPLVNSGTAHARYYLLHAAIAATAPARAGDAAGIEATRMKIRRAEIVQAAVAVRHATSKDHVTAVPYRDAHGARAVEPAVAAGLVDVGALLDSYSRARNGFFAAYRGAEIEAGLLDPRNGTVLPGPVPLPLSELPGVTSLLDAADQDRLDVAAIDGLLPDACLCQVRHGPEFRVLDRLLLDAEHGPGGRGVPPPIRAARRRTAASARLLMHALDGRAAGSAPGAAMADLCYRSADELTAVLGDQLAEWALAWRGALLRNASVTAWRWMWWWLTDQLAQQPRSEDGLARALADALVAGAGEDCTVADLLQRLPQHRDGARLLDVENDLLHPDGPSSESWDPWDYLQVLALGARRLPEVDGPARRPFLEHGELSPAVFGTWLADRHDMPLSQLAGDLTDLLLRQAEKISQARIRWENSRLRIPTRLRRVGEVLFLAGAEGSAEPGLRLERLRQLLQELGYLTQNGDLLTWGSPAQQRWTT